MWGHKMWGGKKPGGGGGGTLVLPRPRPFVLTLINGPLLPCFRLKDPAIGANESRPYRPYDLGNQLDIWIKDDRGNPLFGKVRFLIPLSFISSSLSHFSRLCISAFCISVWRCRDSGT